MRAATLAWLASVSLALSGPNGLCKACLIKCQFVSPSDLETDCSLAKRSFSRSGVGLDSSEIGLDEAPAMVSHSTHVCISEEIEIVHGGHVLRVTFFLGLFAWRKNVEYGSFQG